eukprot:m.119564 g.119564  ORF g.119564 m.119564 type:complete len:300 (+) comp13298_c0_seq4:1659-2558(+)
MVRQASNLVLNFCSLCYCILGRMPILRVLHVMVNQDASFIACIIKYLKAGRMRLSMNIVSRSENKNTSLYLGQKHPTPPDSKHIKVSVHRRRHHFSMRTGVQPPFHLVHRNDVGTTAEDDGAIDPKQHTVQFSPFFVCRTADVVWICVVSCDECNRSKCNRTTRHGVWKLFGGELSRVGRSRRNNIHWLLAGANRPPQSHAPFWCSKDERDIAVPGLRCDSGGVLSTPAAVNAQFDPRSRRTRWGPQMNSRSHLEITCGLAREGLRRVCTVVEHLRDQVHHSSFFRVQDGEVDALPNAF